MTPIPLGILTAGKGSRSYWMTSNTVYVNSNPGTESFISNDITIGPDKMPWVTGYTTGGNSAAILISKFDANGGVALNGSVANVAYKDTINARVGASGSVYWGLARGSGTGWGIYKQNSNILTGSWGRNFAPTYYNGGQPKIAIDSSENIYSGSAVYNTAYGVACVVKYNSSGTIQWQKYFGNASYFNYINKIHYGSNGNIFFHVSANGSNHRIVEIDTNGNAVKEHYPGMLQSLGSQSYFAGVGGGQLLSTGYTGSPYSAIQSTNIASGASNFSHYLFGSGGNLSAGTSDAAIDSAGNVYHFYSQPLSHSVIVKFNSSGVVQWQRNITINGSFAGLSDTSLGSSLAVDADGGLYVRFNGWNTGNKAHVFRIPQDGSITGSWTVGGYTIAISAGTFYTITNETFSSSNSNPNFSMSSSGFTDSSAGVMAFTTTTQTPNNVKIG